MTDAQHEQASDLANDLQRKLQAVVNAELKKHRLTPEQIDLVRTLLSEQARFWD